MQILKVFFYVKTEVAIQTHQPGIICQKDFTLSFFPIRISMLHQVQCNKLEYKQI